MIEMGGRQVPKIMAVAVLGVALCVTMLTDPSAGLAGRSEAVAARGNVASHFPLAKDVPSEHFGTLGERNFHGTRWALYASSAGSRREPCLTLSTISPDGLYGHRFGCGQPAPASEPDLPPLALLVSNAETRHPGGQLVGESFIGMSLSMTVQSIKVALVPGPDVRLQAKPLSSTARREARLDPFRFAMFAVPRPVCIARVTGFDATGAKILDAHTRECD